VTDREGKKERRDRGEIHRRRGGWKETEGIGIGKETENRQERRERRREREREE
jgi:hypothetical protein